MTNLIPQTIFIQHSSTSFITILIPPEKDLTSQWLLEETKRLLTQAFPKERKFSSIVGLITVDSNYAIDHWLSFPQKSLNVLKDQTKLKPFYKQHSKAGSTSKKITLEDFIVETKLGSGSFSTVYLVRKRDTGTLYALKQIRKNEASSKINEMILRERHALLDIKSEYVNPLRFSFQTKNYCYLIQDFMPCGDLHKLRTKKKLSEDDVRFYVVEAILGINDIHNANYIYRDLKPENLLVDFDGYIRFTDFGLAKKTENLIDLNYSICGTLGIAAPEIEGNEGYNYMVDYFNIGTLAYELATRKLPVFSKKDRLFLEDLNPAMSDLSPELRDFIKNLLKPDPLKRLGAKHGIKEICEHPWMRSIDFSLLKMREVQPPYIFDPNFVEIKNSPMEIIEIDEVESEDFTTNKEDLKVTNFTFYELGSPRLPKANSSLVIEQEEAKLTDIEQNKQDSYPNYYKLQSFTSTSSKHSVEETEDEDIVPAELEENNFLKSDSPKAETSKPNKMIKGFLKWGKMQKETSKNSLI